MAEEDDLHVGRRVLEEQLVAPDKLLEVLHEMAEERKAREGQMAPRPLGVLLVSRGYLKQPDLARILGERAPGSGPPVDLEMGRLVVAAGYAPKEAVEECLRIQKEAARRGEPARRLGELLVEKGHLSAAQLQRLLTYQDKAIYACGGCGNRFNVVGAKPDAAYRCKKCGGALKPAGPNATSVSQSMRASASSLLPSVAAGVDAAELDRALAVYLRQKNMIRKDVLRSAEQFQQEATRYGLRPALLDLLTLRKALAWKQLEQLRKVDFAATVKSEMWAKQAVPGYVISRKIAQGGFAGVFAGEPVFGGPTVAIKLLQPAAVRDPVTLDRFRREGRLMMKFSHPHIVKGYDLGEHRALHYLTMELVEGEPLDKAAAGKGLPPADALRLTREVAEALEYMRREGYIHRDVKPENVLLDKERRAKLCDLGFASEIRALAEGQSSVTLGTVGYVSPEQARGERDIKVGTDIYSLGLTLYYMLAGKPPFEAAGSEELMAERFAGEGKSPDLAAVNAPAPVKALLERMTHPDRVRRFTTYAELLAAIPR